MFDVQFSFKEIRKEMQKEIQEEIQETVRKEIQEAVRKESAIQIARNALKKGMSIKDISDITGLENELIEQLDDSIDVGAVQPV